MNKEKQLLWMNRDCLILLGFITIKLFLSLFPLEYGIFRDEFYYLSMSNRLDFGYVDVPPLPPLLLATVRFIFGDSYFSLHLLPAKLAISPSGAIYQSSFFVKSGDFAALVSRAILYTFPS